MKTPSVPGPGVADVLRAWWRNPRLTWPVLTALAALIALRNPSALLHPQLWAEDGGIFLVQNEQLGLGALVTPYVGYLHTLPRLVALAASLVFDPAWWPACYNGFCYLAWIAIVGRTFSPRLDLPRKPLLALAFLFVPLTSEVLLNLTNLQWIAAFILLQQVLIAPPATRAQQAGDLALIFFTGLTGPFAIAFFPLFAWRAWRERDRASVRALLAVASCAVIQAWFVVRTGPHWDYQSQPVNWRQFAAITSRRLVISPLLGRDLALTLPPAVIAAAGGALLAALFLWALRPHPRRLLRAQILLAFAIVLAAGFYRSRFDLWSGDHLIFSDRYFFIPRVLLAWLLIFELDAAPRAVAWTARLWCASIALTHLPGYVLPAPPDYHWAQLCDPIRRGVPANIPTLPEGWTLEYPGRPLPH